MFWCVLNYFCVVYVDGWLLFGFGFPWLGCWVLFFTWLSVFLVQVNSEFVCL